MKKSIVSVALSLAFLVNVTPGFSLDTDDGSGPVNGVIPRGAVPTTYNLPPSSLAELFANSDDDEQSPEEKAAKAAKAEKRDKRKAKKALEKAKKVKNALEKAEEIKSS